jgi:hypothetical protein
MSESTRDIEPTDHERVLVFLDGGQPVVAVAIRWAACALLVAVVALAAALLG